MSGAACKIAINANQGQCIKKFLGHVHTFHLMANLPGFWRLTEDQREEIFQRAIAIDNRVHASIDWGNEQYNHLTRDIGELVDVLPEDGVDFTVADDTCDCCG